MRRWNERVSRLVAAWLAHPTGVAQAFLTTALWFATPFVFRWSYTTAIFWYLAYCTFVSFATQFTLAFQNARAQTAMDATLAALRTLAENDIKQGDAIVEQAHAIWTAVGSLDLAVDQVLKLAHSEAEVQATLAKQDESILGTLTTMRALLAGHAQLAHDLEEPIDRLLSHDKPDGNPADPLQT